LSMRRDPKSAEQSSGGGSNAAAAAAAHFGLSGRRAR